MQGKLRVEGRRHGAGDGREGGAKGVADGLENSSAARFDRGPDEFIVPREGDTHRLRVGLPKPRAPFDVGEEEGDDFGVDVFVRALRTQGWMLSDAGAAPSLGRDFVAEGSGVGASIEWTAGVEPSAATRRVRGNGLECSPQTAGEASSPPESLRYRFDSWPRSH